MRQHLQPARGITPAVNSDYLLSRLVSRLEVRGTLLDGRVAFAVPPELFDDLCAYGVELEDLEDDDGEDCHRWLPKLIRRALVGTAATLGVMAPAAAWAAAGLAAAHLVADLMFPSIAVLSGVDFGGP